MNRFCCLHTLLKISCSPRLTWKFHMLSLLKSRLFTDESRSWAHGRMWLWIPVKNCPFAPSWGLSGSLLLKTALTRSKALWFTVLSFWRSDTSQITSCVNILQVTELLLRSHVREHSLTSALLRVYIQSELWFIELNE